ncbi:helix-turn-helix domain-containing protein [Acanthopleuribacter pedis]|uniref:HTH cro/C1-type domain-containing protein n=1 Tax=Acanthopleuribacter pedis TaxID=442870 RepID=A0A8J7U8R6_9BACT|nr:helix-turn-helix transcriptional regulator [Acanthopleuribacter pedis]MBO1322851.1 hypothetical protein [Acanthopleuribacter pedis]
MQRHDGRTGRAAHEPLYTAYISEPITRCPPREKGRLKNLVAKIAQAILAPPYATRLYIPSQVTAPEVRGQMLPEHVYLLDRIRVVEADYMLVAADHTSFGIGGEVEMATSLGKPVIIFSRDDTLSRFLIGTPANAVHGRDGRQYYLKYRDWRDLKGPLLEMIESLLPDLQAPRPPGLSFQDIGRRVKELRTKHNMTREALANRAGLRPAQLSLLEQPFDVIRKELEAYHNEADLDLGLIQLTPHQLEQLTHVSIAALNRIADVLGTSLVDLIRDSGSTRTTKGPGKQSDHRVSHLRTLREASLKVRAAQFDITFREYEKLYQSLVETHLVTPGKYQQKTTNPRVISEKEFMDALVQARKNR